MTNPALPQSCSTREAATRLQVALSTVQAWVESGHLEAWKTPGGHRRIPLESINRLLASGMAKRDKPAKQAKVLIVEDDPTLRDLYAAHIAKWEMPIAVDLVDNGYDGMLRAAAEVPDLLITDLAMPEMDGFKMIGALKKSKSTAALPIVVVTGLSQEEIDERGGLPAGTTLIFKPVDYPRLRGVIEKLLQHTP